MAITRDTVLHVAKLARISLADDEVEALVVALRRRQAMVLVRQAYGLQALRVAQDLRPVHGVSQHGGVRVCCLRHGWGCDPQRGDGEHRNGLPHDLFLIRCELDASATGRAVLTERPS